MFKIISLALVMGIVTAGNIPFEKCLMDPAGTCTRFEIEGCEPGKRCTVVRGNNLVLDVDFISTKAFEHPKLTMAIYQGGGGIVSKMDFHNSLPHFNADACAHTKCPIEAGVKQTLYLNQTIPDDFYVLTNNMKLGVSIIDDFDHDNNMFCSMVIVDLVDQ